MSGDNPATNRTLDEKIKFQEAELQKQIARDTNSGFFGIGATKPDDDPIVQNLRKGIADLRAKQAHAQMMGALAGAAPTTLVRPNTGGTRPGALASSDSGDDSAATSKAAREHERLLDRRESATRGADSATLALQQRIASITGDTTAMQLAAEQKIEDARKEGIREAFGDATVIAAVNRKAAADRAALELDATQRFIQNKHREDQIAEASAQRQLRAAQLVSRGQIQLAEAALTSVRRHLQLADEHGAPPEVMNTLLNRERDLIEQKRQIEIRSAQDILTNAQREVETRTAKIADLDRMIAQTKELGSLQVTWSMRQPGDVNAPFVSQTTGMGPISVGGAKGEMLSDEVQRLNGELLTWKSRVLDAGQAQQTATEKAISDTDRNIEAQRRLNATIGERIQDRLREDATRSTDTMADIGVRGVYRISDALSDMAARGKFSFKSLVQAANEMANDITRELMREAFRSVILGGGKEGGGLLGGIFDGKKPTTVPGVDPQTQLATTGIQHITTTGTTATTTLTQSGTTSIASIAQVTQAALAAIQQAAAAGGLSGGASGGGGMGGINSLGSIFAGQGPGGQVSDVPFRYSPGDASQTDWSFVGNQGSSPFGTGLSTTTFPTQGGGMLSSLGQMGGMLSIIYQLGSLIGGATGSQTGGFIGGLFGGITGLIASLFHEGGLVMHQGGLVPHFAKGGFAGNEVPAILHKGEMVLSAAETRNLMRYGAARLPIGGGSGSMGSSRSGGRDAVIVNHWHITTADANSFQRSHSQIERTISHRLRQTMRRND